MSDAANRPAQHPDAAIFACDAGHLAYAYAAAMGIHQVRDLAAPAARPVLGLRPGAKEEEARGRPDLRR